MVEAQTGFGNQYKTDNVGAMVGKTWDTGSAWVAYNYEYRSGLLGDDRAFTGANHLAQGGTDLASYNCAAATIETNARAYYPAPYTSTVPATGAGMCDYSGLADLFGSERRHSMMVKIQQTVNDRLTLDGDLLYSNFTGVGRNSRGALTSTITTANPYFQTPIPGATSETVLWDADALLGPGAHTDTGQETFFVHPNATYKLFGDWAATGAATIGWSKSSSNGIGALNTYAANLALNGTTNSAGSLTTPSIPGTNIISTQTLTTANALDPFVVANNPTPPSVIAALTDSYQTQVTRHNIADYSLDFNGSLFQLPAGAVRLALGGEYINWTEQLNRVRPSGIGAASVGESDLDLRMARKDEAGYGEVLVPVISPEMGITAAHRIDLDISGRYDHYSDVGGTFNPKFGADWEPVSGVKLRASYASSFTAPSLNSTGVPTGPWGITGESGLSSFNLGPFTVPYSRVPAAANIPGCNAAASSCVLGTSITGAIITGGNRYLVPQTGRSWLVGVDFTPEQIHGLSISATLWENDITGGITSGNPTVAINSPSLTNQALIIYPNGATAAQVQAATAGLPQTGALPAHVYFLYSYQQRNLLNLWVQGIDYSTSYRFDTGAGRFTLQASGSYLTKFDQQIGGGSVIYSVLNTTGANGTFPSVQFQALTGLIWDAPKSFEGLSAGLFWRHTGAYRNWSGTTVVPVVRNSTGQPIGGGDTVAADDTIDLHVAYDFPQQQGWISGTQIYVDVQNLFDKAPPFYNSAVGYDYYEGNPLGRVVSAGLRKDF